MQVAKYWRNNQLRYRLHGIVQQKSELSTKSKEIDASYNSQTEAKQSQPKVKVA